jgi:tetratricopeptide (TPR) repeat protein
LISALDCPARAIIEERQYQLLEIGPLRRNEQEQLIDSYLGRYTKKLDADRVEQILASPLARSPLFLRVLLEELRQCGRFETLEAQIADYIRPKADGNLAVNDLYGRVLARLERDYGYEPVRKALTALWASRAGLSEPELQSITGLAPLQWAPIDLALEEALGRNGSRLVFGHDYLCKAVEDRYLLSEEQRLQIHNELADWFDCKEEWDERKAEELPWQLLNASRNKEVISCLKDPEILLAIANSLGNEQACRLFILARKEQDISLCSLISRTLTANAEKQDLLSVVDKLSGLFEVLEETSHDSFIELQSLALNSKVSDGVPPRPYIDGLFRLSLAYQQAGRYEEAISSLRQCSEEAQAHMSGDITLKIRLLLHEGNLFVDTGNYLQAESLLKDALLLSSESLCEYDPNIGTIQNSLGYLYRGLARYEEAAILLRDDYERSRNILGSRHQQTIISLRGLAQIHLDMEEYGIAKDLFTKCLEATTESFGLLHPSRITDLSRLAEIASALGEQKEAEDMFKEAARVIEILSTTRISELDIALTNSAYAGFLEQVGRLEEAINLYRRVFEVLERICGQYHHDTIVSLSRYSDCLLESGCFAEAEPHLLRLLSWHSENGDIYWANRNRYDLSRVLYQTRQRDQAIAVLDQLLVSMSTLDELDDSDRQLIDNATNLMTELKATET